MARRASWRQRLGWLNRKTEFPQNPLGGVVWPQVPEQRGRDRQLDRCWRGRLCGIGRLSPEGTVGAAVRAATRPSPGRGEVGRLAVLVG